MELDQQFPRHVLQRRRSRWNSGHVSTGRQPAEEKQIHGRNGDERAHLR
jgi:hypothetical protein